MPDHATDAELTVEALGGKSYLRVAQDQELKRSVRDIEEALKNPDRLGMADPELLDRQKRNEERMLRAGTPPVYDQITLTKLNNMRKELEADIKGSMLNHTEMERGRPGDVDKYFAWHYGPNKGNKKMLALKAIKQTLDRENGEPNFLSITRLRDAVDEVHRVNSPLYRDGYDHVQWEETVEQALVRNMDAGQYQQFLELKVLDWARPSICKELGWAPEMYDAAMSKLRAAAMVVRESAESPEDPGSIEVPDSIYDVLPPDKPVASHRRFQADIGTFGKTAEEFCHDLSLSVETFKTYERSGWSRVRAEQAEGLLGRYAFEQERAAEPADPAEPASTIHTEPVAAHAAEEPV